MKITFTHAGIDRTLTKHTDVYREVAAGTLTPEAAALRPWYLRIKLDGKTHAFRLASLPKKEAIAEARDILNTRTQRPNDLQAFLEAKAAKQGVTIGQLAADWIAAGLPYSKTKPRSAGTAAALQKTLARCLDWWQAKAAASIRVADHEDYVVHRRATVTRGTGSRSADLELSALSCLCDWAVRTDRLKENPFAIRTRYQDAEAVRHCSEFAPETDDQFHDILRTLWRDQNDHATVIAGAWLCFTGLSGLRPEEPAALLRAVRLTEPPTNPRALTPGTIFPTHDGSLKMRIQRNKLGQNPFVSVHPALLEFVKLWLAWLDANGFESGPSARWFPGISADDTSILNRRLAAACAELKLPTIKPKGFGRAYYVKVRRAAGVDDAQIAMELGQTTNGKLIRSTYGDGDDLFGSGLFDWLPGKDKVPAWEMLRPVIGVAPTVNGVARGVSPALPQDTPTSSNLRTAETDQNPVRLSIGEPSQTRINIGENKNPLVKQGDNLC